MTSRQADKRWSFLLLSVLGATILLGRDAAAQSTKTKSPKSAPCADSITTKNGVFTVAQAVRGRDIYAGNCKSCHTVESHTGPAFNAKWNKRPLSELYVYIRDQMPKSNPGSLEPQEYADVLAYVLRMNRLPAGGTELPADSAAMKRVRIEVSKSQ